MHNPQAFGNKAARIQDRTVDEDAIVEAAAGRLFDTSKSAFHWKKKTRRIPHFATLWAAAVALIVFVSGGVILSRTPSQRITALIDGRRADIGEQLWIQSKKDSETYIAFSEGSTIQLAADARARFLEVSDTGAVLLIDVGRLSVNIKHTDKSRWRLLAGPFEVLVTGTRFSLDWDSRRAHLGVEMQEGSVEIRAPQLGQSHRVVAGERFNAWVEEARFELASISSPDQRSTHAEIPGETALRSVQSNETTSAPVEEEDAKQASIPASKAKTPPRSTRRIDVSQCIGSPKDALKTADSDRRDGNIHRAASAYEALRGCFPGTKEAHLAAYDLGIIAFDTERDWPKAARWFHRYLAEQTGEGPVREAMGRLMEAYLHAERRQDALDTARKYLADYPSGPHASFARSLIEEDSHPSGER